MDQVVKCNYYKGLMIWKMESGKWIIEGTKGEYHNTFAECKRIINQH